MHCNLTTLCIRAKRDAQYRTPIVSRLSNIVMPLNVSILMKTKVIGRRYSMIYSNNAIMIKYCLLGLYSLAILVITRSRSTSCNTMTGIQVRILEH